MNHCMANLQVECRRCKGTGKVEIEPSLFQTFTILQKRGKSTATDLHPIINKAIVKAHGHEISATAVNNRLADLYSFGFVTRTRDGKRWIYQAV